MSTIPEQLVDGVLLRTYDCILCGITRMGSVGDPAEMNNLCRPCHCYLVSDVQYYLDELAVFAEYKASL